MKLLAEEGEGDARDYEALVERAQKATEEGRAARSGISIARPGAIPSGGIPGLRK
jgi:hypothetical protein